MNKEKYSLYLNEVRKNLAAPGKPLQRCPGVPTVGALPPRCLLDTLAKFGR
jgi:hypothetical protein